MQLKEKEKLIPHDDAQSLIKIHERFDWTDTLLTEVEKQEIKDIPVDCQDIFVGNRTEIGMSMELTMKLIPENDEAVYSQNLPMPIHLKEDPNVELALMHKNGIITLLSLSKYASSIFGKKTQRNTTSSCGLEENQQPDSRWLQQQQSPIKHFVRRSTTLRSEIFFLQARLLPSKSLFADGGPTVSGNACI